MERRVEKDKNISGNYVAVLIAYQGGGPILGNLKTTHTIAVGYVYIIQRTNKGEFFYRLEGGVVFVQDDFDEGVGLVLAARIGWVIRKRP
jgi:hypothetical protein